MNAKLVESPAQTILRYAEKMESAFSSAGKEPGGSLTVDIADDFYHALLHLKDPQVIEEIVVNRNCSGFHLPQLSFLVLRGLDLSIRSIPFLHVAESCLRSLARDPDISASMGISDFRASLVQELVNNCRAIERDFMLRKICRL
jgi:hypothetical protein